jgi:hypothetical protein
MGILQGISTGEKIGIDLMISMAPTATSNSFRFRVKGALTILLLLTISACTRAKSTNNRIPENVQQVLENVSQLTLFSIDPNLAPLDAAEKQTFHRYGILGKLEVTSPDSRRQVLQALQKDISTWDGNYVMCFNPRHGIRATSGSISFDFLICYECARVELYSGNELTTTMGIGGSQNYFDKLLHAANIPTAK